MRLRLATFGASVALVALGAGAAIADGYVPPPDYVVVPFVSWTGLYIGGHVGGAWSEIDWSHINLTGERFDKTNSGFIGGGQLGYNYQIGNLLLGVEATVSGTDLNRDFRSIAFPTVHFSAGIDTIATVTGRFGYASDQWLFYGKAGWAGAQVNFSGRNPALADSFSLDSWRNGWTLGTGFEYKINRHMSFGVEYSFIDLNSERDSGVTRIGFPVTIRDHDLQVQSVTARLNFQLYRDEYNVPPPVK
ncbi:MAG TPA: outer membrane beta-barrel protein [Hyphomicrobiaceae bacterium]|jgi:outer membrane immunogenic protein